MGEVFEAMHTTIERRVAIKLLHPDRARNREVAARFLNGKRAKTHRRRNSIPDHLGTSLGTIFPSRAP
jgi:hypothetical protein